ncbi:hypothetical protein DESUT3_37410 [Desulfuromonas versatilis]|uniref:ABC transporter substrate-binding protein n=1 Tax=Desulfuromonas versatilis TaxID=2802975 RepID=A0ABN6E2W4_9BACT|nr:ABC transporter substrate-binding protein [Desulfuromonas versatilis]BCR06672.1 hypothetical protein DESUT3_37410 [Desulfuromonas versatilis]
MSPERPLRRFCLLAAAALLLGAAAGRAAEPYPSIAMFEWQPDGAVESGFRDGVQKHHPDARFYVYNAAGDQTLLSHYLETALQRRHDLYYVSGTAAAAPLLARVREVPVVFTMVQDPVDAGLIASWESSENNATGISNRVPVLNQLKALKQIVPFTRLGVVYNPGNPDSRQQLRELERLQPFLGFALEKFPVTAPQQAADLPLQRRRGLEAIYLTRDPLLERLGQRLLEQVHQAGLPSLAADMSLVTRKGALLGLVPDEYRIGRLAALNALEALEGTAPTAIPSRSLDFFMVAVNMQTARRLGVQIPLSLLVIADTIVR